MTELETKLYKTLCKCAEVIVNTETSDGLSLASSNKPGFEAYQAACQAMEDYKEATKKPDLPKDTVVSLRTIKEVRKTVKAIRKLGKVDPEKAHVMEDELYLSFIRSVAFDGCCDRVNEMAKEVLKADDIEFPRWCA